MPRTRSSDWLPLVPVVLGLTGAAQGADSEYGTASVELTPFVVIATKTPRPLANVAGSVQLIDSDVLADQIAVDIADIVRYMPGVSVARTGSRFGWGSYNIRGVGGNRVAVELDGIPIADHFEIGSYSNAGRDALDIGVVKRIEMLYGPASTLYGSDALGGVVAYRTFDPEDLAGQGSPYYALASGYRHDQQAYSASVTTAWLARRHGGLIALGQRQGKQRDASAVANPPEDRQDWDTSNLFGKWTWRTATGNELKLTVDRYWRDTQTDIRAILGSGRFRSTTALRGEDQLQRTRLSLAYEFASPWQWLRDGELLAYQQNSEADQYTVEERAASDLRRERRFLYQPDTKGVEFSASATLTTPRAEHRISYGMEFARNRTTESRDGWQTTLDGREHTNVVLGEQFPVRDFPISRSTEYSLYLQDEVSLGALTLIPALRYDRYHLQPRPDALYLEDFPATEIVGIDESHLAPKLGVVYALDQGWSLFGQYARGFRAPPFEDVNIGLDIPLFNYRALPNPDLRSETSDGVEVGVRRLRRNFQFSVSAHYTQYDNFIESRARLGIDPDSGALLFQSRNLDEAHIYGAELSYRATLGSGLAAHAALVWTRGENKRDDAPVNAIDPAEMILGFDWQSARLPLTAGLQWTLAGAKKNIDNPDNDLAATSGFGIVDVNARYEQGSITLRAGMFNVFDKAHWRWSNVSGLGGDDPARPGLSEPGRHAGISVLWQW